MFGEVRESNDLFLEITCLKINMELENHLFEKANHLPNPHFWVPC